jgi:multiple sugar transport system substrate-binding protein
MRFRSIRRLVIAASLAAGVCVATVPGLALGGQRAKAAQAPVQITFWSWVPNIQNEVNQFNASHPGIQVNYVNAGQGETEYQKLTTALQAGSGAPDVVQVEYQYIPQYVALHGLANIAKYIPADTGKLFVNWVWKQVSPNSKTVWAIPQDSGPLGMLYRTDIFQQYGLTVPTTWAQFAADAVKLHAANSSDYLADFPVNDGGALFGMIWQTGAKPFIVKGTTITINLDSPAIMKWAEFWGKLIYAHDIAAQPDFETAWYTDLTNGTYASMTPAAAWAPVFLEGVASSTSGKWGAALTPQWSTKGAPINGNWGGSTSAVTLQSKYPKQAAEFADWLNTNTQSASEFANTQSLYPTLKSLANSPSYANQSVAFYGGQEVNKLFAKASNEVSTSFQFSPFQIEVYTVLQDQLGEASLGQETFATAMKNTQAQVVAYAKLQGYKVNT